MIAYAPTSVYQRRGRNKNGLNANALDMPFLRAQTPHHMPIACQELAGRLAPSLNSLPELKYHNAPIQSPPSNQLTI